MFAIHSYDWGVAEQNFVWNGDLRKKDGDVVAALLKTAQTEKWTEECYGEGDVCCLMAWTIDGEFLASLTFFPFGLPQCLLKLPGQRLQILDSIQNKSHQAEKR